MVASTARRGKLSNEPEGVYILNAGKQPYTGWVRMDPASFVRTPYKSVIDSNTGKKQNLVFCEGKAQFWVNDLPVDKVCRYTLSLDSVTELTLLSQRY